MTAALIILLGVVLVLLAITGLTAGQFAVWRAGEDPTVDAFGGQPTREREH